MGNTKKSMDDMREELITIGSALNLKIEDLCTQLEHHSDYFYDKSIVLDDDFKSNKKLINEYFTYSKVMANFVQELNEINSLVNKLNNG